MYTDEHLQWLLFIHKMRDSHMSLSQIKAYGELYQIGEETVDKRRTLLVEHQNIIQKEIHILQEIDAFIKEKIKLYDEKYNKK